MDNTHLAPGGSVLSGTYERHQDLTDDMGAWISADIRCESHFHRKLEIIYMLEGEAEVGLGGTVYRCGADEIVFVHHYERHSYAPAPSYRKYVFLLSPALSGDFAAVFKAATLPPVMADRAVNRKLKPVFRELLHSAAHNETLQVKGYLNVIIGKLIAHYQTVPLNKSGNSKFIYDVLDYIDRHYDRPLSLNSIAAAFGYNRYHISKLWSQSIGINLSVYIHQIRLRHAVDRLKTEGDNKIADIAYACGFDSLTTFYRCFHDKYGVSPKHYIANAAP